MHNPTISQNCNDVKVCVLLGPRESKFQNLFPSFWIFQAMCNACHCTSSRYFTLPHFSTTLSISAPLPFFSPSTTCKQSQGALKILTYFLLKFFSFLPHVESTLLSGTQPYMCIFFALVFRFKQTSLGTDLRGFIYLKIWSCVFAKVFIHCSNTIHLPMSE